MFSKFCLCLSNDCWDFPHLDFKKCRDIPQLDYSSLNNTRKGSGQNSRFNYVSYDNKLASFSDVIRVCLKTEIGGRLLNLFLMTTPTLL